ncbi:hypothetical protein niasHS_009209 [Heterodera schachtii]|uniref:Major facilitator superfamily (MFS) profile domain-containing protein n=2 Tax=Heterodera TaxID=34509 RepID=A0ABD2IXH8_HETSC
MIGVIFGSMLFGYLSDSYGRRKIMLIALILCILSMVASSFTFDLLSFTIVRFFVNFFNAGTMVTLVVFTSEHYPKKHRFCLANLITWSPNFVLFAIMAYFAHDWRTLQRVSAALATPCVPILYFLSESPRFLVQCRRMVEAKAAILRMHRIDGRECNESVLDAVLAREERQHEATKGQKKYNYLHLFYTWRFVRYTTAVAISFFIVSLMNYSLLFGLDSLSGSLFMNGIMMGAFRYSMNLAISFGDMRFKWLGRKFAHFLADALAAIALLLYITMDLTGYRTELPLVANWCVLSVIGFCSLLYTTNGLAANELFPTGVRNASYSFGQVLSRIGVVLAPLLLPLSVYWGPLPYVLLLVLAVFDAFYFQFNVIETKDRPMGSKFPDEEERIFYGKFRRGAAGRKTDVELLPRGGANAEAPGADGAPETEEKK